MLVDLALQTLREMAGRAIGATWLWRIRMMGDEENKKMARNVSRNLKREDFERHNLEGWLR